MRPLSFFAMGTLALAASTLAFASEPATPSASVKDIVIVHGAFVDGSGWRVVHDILVKRGYKVNIVQPPLTTLNDDVAATEELINKQDSGVVLVGHSYGGQVISIAGAQPKVKALVYVAAFQPEVGESVEQLVASMPAPSHNIISYQEGHLFFDPSKFADDFADDLPPKRARFMAISQVPASSAIFSAKASEASWHNKPSYGIVATGDRALSPDLQRWMYKRAGSKITEVRASHVIYISQPEAVAKVIEEAAENAQTPQ